MRAFDDDMLIVNMSVWESVEALGAFTCHSAHREVMRRGRQWFERLSDPHLVLWWVGAGAIPSVGEAKERLAVLRRCGPSPEAFTFRSPYPPPGTPTVGNVELPGREPPVQREAGA